ncbi:MAG: serine acetyltransferase, partial [Patescibacteria group bacterium]
MYFLKMALNPIGTLLLLLLIVLNKENKELKMDLYRYNKENNLKNLIKVFLNFKEFRNIFYYRAKKSSIISKIAVKLCKLFYKEEGTLIISCDNIKGGLFIQHGIATIITASEIGENCQINQQVTIGYNLNSGKPPVIGDN